MICSLFIMGDLLDERHHVIAKLRGDADLQQNPTGQHVGTTSSPQPVPALTRLKLCMPGCCTLRVLPVSGCIQCARLCSPQAAVCGASHLCGVQGVERHEGDAPRPVLLEQPSAAQRHVIRVNHNVEQAVACQSRRTQTTKSVASQGWAPWQLSQTQARVGLLPAVH